MNRTDSFSRHVAAIQGIYYRMDRGLLTGRNGDATADTLNYHYKHAAAILRAACLDDQDTLPEYLDSKRGARLAAKWNGFERRHHNL